MSREMAPKRLGTRVLHLVVGDYIFDRLRAEHAKEEQNFQLSIPFAVVVRAVLIDGLRARARKR